ncbi:hypothetical protein F5884DRAFT_373448 [Xylogone sp. PMI_703]|nr:hypothetical protein F5884DRAFT_373448 [Xylogone sp. PMI_703]
MLIHSHSVFLFPGSWAFASPFSLVLYAALANNMFLCIPCAAPGASSQHLTVNRQPRLLGPRAFNRAHTANEREPGIFNKVMLTVSDQDSGGWYMQWCIGCRNARMHNRRSIMFVWLSLSQRTCSVRLSPPVSFSFSSRSRSR